MLIQNDLMHSSIVVLSATQIYAKYFDMHILILWVSAATC